LKAEVFTLQRNQSSRRGLEGARGIQDDPGPSGRDAFLIFKTDVKDNVIRVFDEAGNEKATLISIPGRDGRDAVAKDSRDGTPGKPGKDAPSLDEVVRAVLHEVKACL